MPGIQALHHVKSLPAPDFADDDPIRPHTQAGFDQISDRDLTAAFHIGVTLLHPHKVWQSENLQFGVILDRNNAFFLRNVIRQGI